MGENVVERVARAMWEHWRTLSIASPECVDCDWDEINRLAALPLGNNPAALIRDAALSQARVAIEAMRDDRPEDARPKRIQRKRTNGWRMPEGAIYVGRPTLWGNRYKIGTWSNTLGREVRTLAEAVELYRSVVWDAPDGQHMAAYAREQLRGRDLVCWCALDQPCHADVLLDLANG